MTSARKTRLKRAAAISLAIATVVSLLLMPAPRTAVEQAFRNSVGPYLDSALAPFLSSPRTLCADFNDASGLYKGNKVLLLGVEIGSIVSVSNMPDHVRVEFTVPDDMVLPADIGAASYTTSVMANRSVELSAPYRGGPEFTGAECIPAERTRTPISVTESFAAMSNLADTIIGPDHGPDLRQAPGIRAIGESLDAAARSVDGTGSEFRRMLIELTTMVGDPRKADASYRELLENGTVITSDWLRHWDDFRTVMQTLVGSTRLVEGLADGLGTALFHLVNLIPVLTEAVNRWAGRGKHNIGDKLFPWLRDILNAYTPHLLSFFATLPPGVNWLADDFYLPNMATHNVTYVPPRVAISPEQASAICAGLRERGTPGASTACAPGTASDPVTLGLTNLIMGGALS
ncbi:MlaD family protein [Mycobacteroides saopaulense]|uniref:Mammalian cell entry protein n=1 Tax=Mycobacteroides saopaulense TaxID=1578165 RepID=A0ABX3BZ41_9MYCO|nr:MlaD family protein [Mycobacteroides saopaulense]ALR10748.1 mammalian cell entry protein [Mycobacteroides saopaulense]OHT81489.1 mammalian cell entry protein [Mycobacteroides saopaulense]OHU09017.1 mammalian cell entry protein [Mycobacteroides saopaulense]